MAEEQTKTEQEVTIIDANEVSNEVAEWNFDAKKVANEVVEWTKKHFESLEMHKAYVPISGGVDSAVVAAICAEALGKANVFGVKMPFGVQKDIHFSNDLIEHLQINDIEINIGGAIRMLEGQIPGYTRSKTTQTNLPSRIRSAAIFACAEADSDGALVANTSDFTKDICGHTSFFGSSTGSFAPIQLLTRKEVVAVGMALGLPEKFVNRTHEDENEENVGFNYDEVHDAVRLGIKGPNYKKISELFTLNVYKMEYIQLPRYEPADLPIDWPY